MGCIPVLQLHGCTSTVHMQDLKATPCPGEDQPEADQITNAVLAIQFMMSMAAQVFISMYHGGPAVCRLLL